jgi:hypothetical protein
MLLSLVISPLQGPHFISAKSCLVCLLLLSPLLKGDVVLFFSATGIVFDQQTRDRQTVYCSLCKKINFSHLGDLFQKTNKSPLIVDVTATMVGFRRKFPLVLPVYKYKVVFLRKPTRDGHG